MTQRRYPEGALGPEVGPRWRAVRRPRLPWALRRARRRVFHFTILAVAALVRRAPRPLAVRTLRFLAGVADRLRVRERQVALEQMRRAMPHLQPQECRRLVRASFDAMARNLADMIRNDIPVRIDARTGGTIERARQQGPVVVLMGHCGAWELIGPALVERMAPFAALTADPHNEWVDRWLRRERSARGITVFDRERELRRALRWLRDGGTLAILADHRTRGSQVLAPWFGTEAPTATGPSRIAGAAGASILPLAIRREGDGHRLEAAPAFVPTGDEFEDARRCNAALEAMILRNPEEWTWIHDRYGDLA